ncbi:MAG: hypothetical protein ND807_01895 [Vicinamibacterales bacterium]|nr:hypothetical protein [Vicinamibacterales bacterium]
MANVLESVRPWWLLPPGRIHPAWWVAACAGILWSDYLGGLEYFPLLYAVPVALAAWYSGRGTAMALAVAVPVARLVFLLELPSQAGLVSSLGLTTIARGIVVFFIGLWFARLSEVEHALDRRVQVLEGMLPICSFCKSIRNESGEWERLDTYISRKSEVQFTHGFCPSCGAVHYGAGSDMLNP